MTDRSFLGFLVGATVTATVINFGLQAQAQAPAPQQPTYNVTVTAQELDAIGNALGKAPFEVAAPIIQKLREQVIAQNKPVTDAKPVEEKK